MKALFLAFAMLACTSAQQRREPPVRSRGALDACDVNADGKDNVADLQIVIDVLIDVLPYTPAADINKDGVVNIADFQIELNADLGYGCHASQ